MLIRLSPSGRFIDVPTGGSLTVTNIAALALLPVNTDTPDWVWVEKVACYWHRNVASTLVPDGITVVAAIGGGNWERCVPTTVPDWLAQATWAIDPLLGNDEALGTPAAPLRTSAELNRRLSIGALGQNTIVTIPAAALIPEIDLEIDPGIFLFTIRGTPTVIANGVITTFTERTHVGPTPEAALITDGGVADWTPYIGQRLRLTSGINAGAVAWIALADPNGIGLNVARISRFAAAPVVNAVPALAPPAPLDTYTIESLPVVQAFSLRQRRAAPQATGLVHECFRVENIRVDGANKNLFVGTENNSSFILDACDIRVHMGTPLGCGIDQQHMVSRSCVQSVTPSGGPLDFECCLQFGSMGQGTTWYRYQHHTAQGTAVANQYGFYQALANTMVAPVWLLDTQLFDYLGAAILLQNTCFYQSRDGLSGFANAVGMRVGDADNEATMPQSFSWAEAADLPNLLGNTADIRIVSAGPTYLDFLWTDLIEPFNSNEQNGEATLVGGTITVGGAPWPAHNPRFPNIFHVFVQRILGGAVPRGDLMVTAEGVDSFEVQGRDLTTGALVATDTGSFRWHIPAWGRPVWIGQGSGLQLPN